MKILNIILIAIFTLSAYSFGVVISRCPECPPEKVCEVCPLPDYYQDLYSKFQPLDLVMNITKGKWKYNLTDDKDRYVCHDFSKDFERYWNEMGYDGIMIFGSTPQGRAKNSVGHTWYAIYVEPMTGEFVKVNQYIPEDRNFYIMP